MIRGWNILEPATATDLAQGKQFLDTKLGEMTQAAVEQLGGTITDVKVTTSPGEFPGTPETNVDVHISYPEQKQRQEDPHDAALHDQEPEGDRRLRR